MGAWLWAGKEQEDELIFAPWIDVYLAWHLCYTFVMSQLGACQCLPWDVKKPQCTLLESWINLLRVLWGWRKRSGVPHPSLLQQPQLQATQCSVRLCRADGSNGKGVGGKCRCCKGTKSLSHGWQGRWQHTAHGEHGLQVIVEVILKTKTHMLCCLRASWLWAPLWSECETLILVA